MPIESRGFKVDSGTGRPLRVPVPQTWFKVTGADTGGALTLCEYEATFDIPPHVHEREHECVYMLAGRVRVTVGDEDFELGPRDFCFMPKGVPHAITRASEPPITMLAISTPSGFEHFMEDLSEALAAGLDRSSPQVAEIRARHGWVPLSG